MITYLKRTFSTVKLTIYLLCFLSVASIIGTLIQQKQSPEFYIKIYGDTAYRVMEFFSIPDIYHSWWFSLLLLLLAINLLVCSTNRLPQILRFLKHQKALPPSKLQTMRYKTQFTIKSDFAITSKKLLSWFTDTFHHSTSETDKKSVYCFWEKGLIGRFGFFMVHLSIIIILFGGIIGLLWGFRGSMRIIEGETNEKIIIPHKREIIELPFTVKCDKFNIEFYKNTERPKSYESYVTLLEKNSDRTIKDAVIKVNHPLHYQGIRLYQASYGKTSVPNELTIIVKNKHTGAQQSFTTGLDNNITWDEGKLHLTMLDYKPDFMMDERKRIVSRSFTPNNPALKIEIREEGKAPYRAWLFAKFSKFHGTKKDSDYMISFVGPKIKIFTVLEVSKDPGVALVWIGCILLTLGLMAVFFISHKRIWLTATETENNQIDILFVGSVDRGKFDFEMYFNKLCSLLKKAVSAEDSG